MTATEQLKAEHDGIKLMLRIMEKLCERLESGKDVEAEHLERIHEFLTVFVDKCHHAKEEDLLFPALENAGEGGPIGVMLSEHNKARQLVKGIGEGIARYKAGDTGAAARIAANARDCIRILTAHIDKENNVLYPLAEARIPKSKLDELLTKFEQVETERIGPGKHEEFHKMLEKLKSVYLS